MKQIQNVKSLDQAADLVLALIEQKKDSKQETNSAFDSLDSQDSGQTEFGSMPGPAKDLVETSSRSLKSPLIISLDGRCASGKTTLAGLLESRLPDCVVVHLDDFFLQPDQRTPERYARPGKNVDDQRAAAEVLEPAWRGQSIVYRPFSCRTMSLQDPIDLGCPRILILEGAYSCNQDLAKYADLKIFATISPVLQQERILKRNGPQKLKDFQDKWIPLEEKYFATLNPVSDFDLVVDLSAL